MKKMKMLGLALCAMIVSAGCEVAPQVQALVSAINWNEVITTLVTVAFLQKTGLS